VTFSTGADSGAGRHLRLVVIVAWGPFGRRFKLATPPSRSGLQNPSCLVPVYHSVVGGRLSRTGGIANGRRTHFQELQMWMAKRRAALALGLPRKKARELGKTPCEGLAGERRRRRAARHDP
jgi:hypothetical protein